MCDTETGFEALFADKPATFRRTLHRAMALVRRRTLPQGLLGQAIDYALKRWEALTRFVDDGVLEIDSNLI